MTVWMPHKVKPEPPGRLLTAATAVVSCAKHVVVAEQGSCSQGASGAKSLQYRGCAATVL